MVIHWCGAGPYAMPGLKRLIEAGHQVLVWAETPDIPLHDIDVETRPFDIGDLAKALSHHDIIVSMLPENHHLALAHLCIKKRADFINPHYISPDMRALDEEAKQASVRLVNEVGFAPGIDHLMAHWLVTDYRADRSYNIQNALSFRSYFGDVPTRPNGKRYKFGWSPEVIIDELQTPSRSIRSGSEMAIQNPWDALREYTAPLLMPEVFEVYPSRDSLPFIQQYHFDTGWKIKNFVRGTLRLKGWADAWSDIFAQIARIDDSQTAELMKLIDENTYEKGEADRAVLCVGLRAELDGVTSYDKTYTLDAHGDERGQAIARLVSGMLAMSVDAVLAREIPVGVTSAPHDTKLVSRFLEELRTIAQHVEIIDNLR